MLEPGAETASLMVFVTCICCDWHGVFDETLSKWFRDENFRACPLCHAKVTAADPEGNPMRMLIPQGSLLISMPVYFTGEEWKWPT
jgi:hypothetical protein